MITGLYKPFQHWAKKGTVWLYSDPHFNDPDLLAYREITAEEQIKRINSKVGKNDTLIILGDVGDIDCVRQLRGYKILIMGNHDAGRTNYERKKYEEIYYRVYVPTKEEALAKFKKQHSDTSSIQVTYHQDEWNSVNDYWVVTGDNHLFDEAYEGPLMISEKILLSHEPITVPWAFNVHGHNHSTPSAIGHLNCCAEMINYTPINFNQIIKQGIASKIPSIHRTTINEATKRAKKKRNKH